MYPLTSVNDLLFTRDHESIVRAVQRFEGRKFDYTPRNMFEQQYARASTQDVERIRNDVVMGALRGLSVRLGSLREGRKSIIFVSEGFTAMLPPQMQRLDASAPADPRQVAAGALGQDSAAQQTAEWFSQADIYQRLRDVFQDANRNNTSIYSLDPRGLTPFAFDIDDGLGGTPSFAIDSRTLQMTQDTLRTLAEETDGRAIVNRNSLVEGLAQIARDSSFYYLLGYNSTEAPDDGQFHEIEVRVKRPGVDVRARKGYWAYTAEDVIRAQNPTPDLAKPVQTALASISTAAQAGQFVRTWIGTERADAGKTRVTLVWEPLPQSPGVRREQAGRVSLLAATAQGDLVFRGGSPETAAAPAATTAAAPPPQRITFEAAPGTLELRMTVEEAGGSTLDREIRTIDVPDLTAPDAAMSTPRVFRARTARDVQALTADPAAIPTAAREFSRTERVLVRFDVYGAGSDQAKVTAAMLNRSGDKMTDIPVTPAASGGTHQINLSLAPFPGGEYLVEITVPSAGGDVKELVPLRIGT
jgi:VWFA-related protein